MKALALTPPAGELRVIELAEPAIAAPAELKLRVLEVGICGTDREQVRHGRLDHPSGPEGLVLGPEMLGRVVEVGAGVGGLAPGDLAVLTVRRGCDRCVPCRLQRSDLCSSGGYREHGIKGLRGYQSEYVVDDARYAVRLPETLRAVGVLTEPLSVAEKAIDEAGRLQTERLPASADWPAGRRALVAGLGPVGRLAAMVLRLRGAEVLGLDIVAPDSARPAFLRELGGSYLDGRGLDSLDIRRRHGELDFIFEASGVAALGWQLIDALGVNGAYVMTGLPQDEREVCLPGAEFMQRVVLKNQLLLGSVNASTAHFAQAIRDLEAARARWGRLLERLVTRRLSWRDFLQALELRSADDIKTVVQWGEG